MTMMRSSTKRLSTTLGVLQILTGLLGVAGGIPMILDPSGKTSGFDLDWLAGSPFTDYLIPGLVLLIVNGLGSVAAGMATLRSFARAAELAIALGVFLMVWIIIQVAVIGLSSWMQPLFFAIGLTEGALGLMLRRSLITNPKA
jgi:hypothetical protein